MKVKDLNIRWHFECYDDITIHQIETIFQFLNFSLSHIPSPFIYTWRCTKLERILVEKKYKNITHKDISYKKEIFKKNP